jgi:hypothetical protein
MEKREQHETLRRTTTKTRKEINAHRELCALSAVFAQPKASSTARPASDSNERRNGVLKTRG